MWAPARPACTSLHTSLPRAVLARRTTHQSCASQAEEGRNEAGGDGGGECREGEPAHDVARGVCCDQCSPCCTGGCSAAHRNAASVHLAGRVCGHEARQGWCWSALFLFWSFFICFLPATLILSGASSLLPQIRLWGRWVGLK